MLAMDDNATYSDNYYFMVFFTIVTAQENSPQSTLDVVEQSLSYPTVHSNVKFHCKKSNVIFSTPYTLFLSGETYLGVSNPSPDISP